VESPDDIKMIYAGKILENAKTFEGDEEEKTTKFPTMPPKTLQGLQHATFGQVSSERLDAP